MSIVGRRNSLKHWHLSPSVYFCGIIVDMKAVSLRGQITLAAIFSILLLFLSALPGDISSSRPHLSEVASPTAAQQIWEIGAQPVPYLQDGQTQIQTGEAMWGQS